MATLKQRLHRKNASGAYDTIHFETSADMIVGSVAIANGGTGATTAANARTNLGITPANIGAAASSHSHDASNITSGTLSIARGGTGATTAANARSTLGITPANIGAATSSHNHSASQITSGTLSVSRGGTGITANPSMLTNLGSTSAASVFTTSPRPGITGTLSAAHGGTGVTSLAALKSALGLSNLNYRIEYGTNYNNNYGSGTVYFSTPFSGNPVVILTPYLSSGIPSNRGGFAITYIDARSFSYTIDGIGGGSACWIAIGT